MIKSNLKIPVFLSLCYPALKLTRSKKLSPSFLESFEDIFLTVISLLSIVDSYLDTDDNEMDPFISPNSISDKIIMNKMPKTTIYIGSLDSFLDDCYRFVYNSRFS